LKENVVITCCGKLSGEDLKVIVKISKFLLGIEKTNLLEKSQAGDDRNSGSRNKQ